MAKSPKSKEIKLKFDGTPRKQIDTLGRKANGGHPGVKLTSEEVHKLAILWCTHEEIAAHFDVSVDTITRRFADVIKKGREEGKASLRRVQWSNALEGNTSMQIWLGKNILKQKDSFEDLENIPKNDESNAIKHENMILRAELAAYKENYNAHQS